jgi:hypothetical protein
VRLSLFRKAANPKNGVETAENVVALVAPRSYDRRT